VEELERNRCLFTLDPIDCVGHPTRPVEMMSPTSFETSR
jgi:hypothetical protein